MKRRLVILYRNHSYKSFSVKNLGSVLFDHPSIDTIFVPLDDHPNLYIPIKPSPLLNCRLMKIHIQHRIYSYDYEEGIGEDLTEASYDLVCDNIVTFANALFNLYKFRGASIAIVGATVSGITVSFTSYPTRINIEFYEDEEKLIDTIDSGDMGSLEDGMNLSIMAYEDISTKKIKKKLSVVLPQYGSDDRFQCLKEILNTPEDIEDLPNYYAFRNEKHWDPVDLYSDVNDTDYLMVKIADFGAYYSIDSETLVILSDRNCLRGAIIRPICCPYSELEIERFNGPLRRSFKRIGKPTRAQKELWRRSVINGDLFNPLELEMVADTGEQYLAFYALFRVITNYLEYFISASYNIEDCECLSLALFGDDQIILEKSEYTDDHLTDVFLEMIK